MPFWDEPSLLKSGIFSDFGNLSVPQALSCRLTEGCTFTCAHVTQRRIFFYIFHSKIPLFCLFSIACEAQAVSWLCTKDVEAEEVHSVPSEFSELCRCSSCAGAVGTPADPSQAGSGSRSKIQHQPQPEGLPPSPSLPSLPQQKSAAVFVCTGG